MLWCCEPTVEYKLTSFTFQNSYLFLSWITYECCNHNYALPWANRRESRTDHPRYNSYRDSPFGKVHSSVAAANSSLGLYVVQSCRHINSPIHKLKTTFNSGLQPLSRWEAFVAATLLRRPESTTERVPSTILSIIAIEITHLTRFTPVILLRIQRCVCWDQWRIQTKHLGGSQIGGRQKGLLLEYQRLSAAIGVTQKWLPYVGQIFMTT